MEYIERIQKTIDFIEENLKNPITLDKLAEQAFISKYYYHRLFTVLVGKAPMEYVRNRRLVSAARQLAETEKSVLEIAIEHNFESQEVFTRAFNRFFEISPGKYRKINDKIKLNGRISLLGLKENKEEELIKPKIIYKEEIKIAGYRFCTTFKENVEKSTIAKFWNEKMNDIMTMKNRVNPYENIGICEGEDVNECLHHTACVQVSSFDGLDDDIVKETIPASKYIVFSHKGKAEKIAETYYYIYKKWLPYAGYELSKKGRDMQIYDVRKYEEHGEFSEMDIYLPIE